jgi:nicotinamide-nucleotide amidase
MIDDQHLMRLAQRVGRRLSLRHLNMTTAESCTGGFIAKVVTDIAGSSAWFADGVVTYSNASKTRLLGVTAAALERHGAVSELVARQMAVGARQRTGSDVAVAVTGIAGPGGATPGKPVGTVWLAWAVGVGRTRVVITMRKRFRGDRDDVRRKTVDCALRKLLQLVR